MMLGLLACGGNAAPDAGGGARPADGTQRYAIAQVSDCQAIRDYPYARHHLCPAAFSAAQVMVSEVAGSLGVRTPTRGFFAYYETRADPQAPPDDQAQTTVPCLFTRAPWSAPDVFGAGRPLCRLLAYVMSPGPSGTRLTWGADPLPDELRAYPEFFTRLYTPDAASPLSDFRVGAAFDATVRKLGAAGHDEFLADYPAFSPAAIYDPVHWGDDAQYHGISGGGGGGWGGELGVERPNAVPVVLLAFGGGGGGGMTSTRSADGVTSRAGAGGGAGMQLADGYRFNDVSYDGLGLGAGVGSEEDAVQYSYFDYAGAARPAQPVHNYNPAVIADYQDQLRNLVQQLKDRMQSGETVVLRGGGGMGAGAEYLRADGEEFAPHALSMQAGFQFRYEFQSGGSTPATVPGNELDVDQEGGYAKLGDFYRQATAAAYQECGRDYANFPCICRTAHASVIRMMGSEWVIRASCPPGCGRRTVRTPARPTRRVDSRARPPYAGCYAVRLLGRSGASRNSQQPTA